MHLTEKEKQLILMNFANLIPIQLQFANLFYNRLWEIAPETKPVFERTNMREQSRKLMATLVVVLDSLGNLDALTPVLKDLGRRHKKYNVKTEQFAAVGEALLWTLEQYLKKEFTPQARDAWAKVYKYISDVAISAYEEEVQAV